MTTIYAFCDPRSGSPFYIGQSVDVFRRYREHTSPRGGSPLYGSPIMQDLRQAGLIPMLITLHHVRADAAASRRYGAEAEAARRAEAFEIVRAVRQGFALANSAREIRRAQILVARYFPEVSP